MTRGAWMCRQQDDGLKIWLAPRVNEKPFTDPERAQKWRLSLASLLFLTVLLSDHLWFCAEAKLTRTRDKLDKLAFADMGDYPAENHMYSPSLHFPHGSLRKSENVIFIGNSTGRFWRPETCHPDSLSKNCFTFDDAEPLCRSLSDTKETQSVDLNLSDLYLSFCNSYSLLDLFYGLSSLDNLNCSLDTVTDGDVAGCSQCVQAYQRYDQHAQEKYEEFEILIQKYETDAYSVRTCMEECKMVYKSWLCSQYFQTTQMHCINKIPCKQYCLEVQKRCPFILPDNDDLIHGGSPSFICTGLLENHLSSSKAECCDVRWDFKPDNYSEGTVKRTHPSCHHKTSVTTSAASRLCNTRLKLCMLVLVLLHTISTLTAAQNPMGLDFWAVTTVEEGSSEE
ncbi:NALCN channel auxiliary factor 1 [Paramormyrops kingsleyae]|uniref:NALCN channel auxiliary factor 1 n=1 Tax=Paramormyrops kingsleyae TaxID=1676925 RepID=A0A3B3SKX3_9TELE|nr:transmembrane protein FAM155A [Paramormyrops kingsleyae]